MKAIKILIVCLLATFCLRYCWQMVAGQIAPVLATWIVFLVATQMSLFTYLRSSEKHTWLSNIYIVADCLNVIIVLLVAIFLGKKVRLGLTFFEIGCLTGCAIIAMIWFFSRSHVLCNLMIQVMMIIAYFPLVYHLWNAPANTEPYFPWLITMLASTLAMYEPIKKRDLLAAVYLTRSTLSVLVVIMLMIRLDIMRSGY